MEMPAAWKAWKAKIRLPTLPTVLGNRAKAARFPHSHSFPGDSSYALGKRRIQKKHPSLTDRKNRSQQGGPN
jgi:hypothetical protein